MGSRKQKPRAQGERPVTHADMNYAQVRALYGPEVVDTITRELSRKGCRRVYITRREHERLVEWKGTGDRRVNGIVKNIVEGQPERRGRVTRTDEPPQGDAFRVERLLAHADPTSADHALVRFAADKIVAGLPDAAFAEHEVFLRAKLEEARLVAEALDRLAKLDSAMERTTEAAAGALRESRFEDLEMTLADAESSTADADVRRSVRAVRGEAALVRGHATQAAAHFVAAADYMKREEDGPGSGNETMVFRSRAVARLVRHADTFGGDGAWIGDAMKLCYANIRIRNTDLWNGGARQMDAGNAQLSAGRLKKGKEALDLFAAANHAFCIASGHFGSDGFPVDWAAAQNGRGLAMAHSCFWYEEVTGEPERPGRWTFAAGCYAAAMEVQREAGETSQWAETRINWGYLLLRRGRAEGGRSGQEFLGRAVDLCRGAQRAINPDAAGVWVNAQLTLAETLLALAKIDRPEAENHLSLAAVELRLAQDFLSHDLPLMVARTKRLMARLQEQMEGVGEAPSYVRSVHVQDPNRAGLESAGWQRRAAGR